MIAEEPGTFWSRVTQTALMLGQRPLLPEDEHCELIVEKYVTPDTSSFSELIW